MDTFYKNNENLTLLHGDMRKYENHLPIESVQTIITSPPYYGLRDYDSVNQIGQEASVLEYVKTLVAVFSSLKPTLKANGTLWLNIGDTYLSDKNLAGIPWRVALALQDDGWILRSDVIWHKPNAMPSSAKDRLTIDHEYFFLFAKQRNYFFDSEPIRVPQAEATIADMKARGNLTNKGTYKDVRPDLGRSRADYVKADGLRRKRTVWTVHTRPFKEAHFATFPEALVLPPILSSSRVGDVVLDPFSGSGTTGAVALQHGRHYVGIDSNKEYLQLSLDTRLNRYLM